MPVRCLARGVHKNAMVMQMKEVPLPGREPPPRQRRSGKASRVAIGEVARCAGVSVATVSRVLNGITNKNSPGTIARVRAAIEELGYRKHGRHSRGCGFLRSRRQSNTTDIGRVAVAGASEVMCRLGMTAPGAWQRRGFHPTASAALVASRMLGMSPLQMGHALGIAGSQAAGLMESWVDGATVRYAHGGWAAHSGVAAAYIARAGITGPAAVFEGRYGLLATHLQNASDEVVPSRLVDGLGVDWESRRTSFKPYPAAHVLHSFIDALLHLQREEGLSARDVKRVVCRVADYMVPLVCEPAAERLRPSNDSTARVSLQYTIAETLVRGGLDARSYDAGSLRDPEILSLADKVAYEIDESAPGRERFKGWVVVETVDGRVLERVEDYNRGSAERPLSEEEVREKFVRNASARLKPEAIAQVVDMVDRLPKVHNIEDLVSSCCSDDVCRTDPARTL